MKNRILFVFLALVLVVSLAAFVACQAEEEEVEKPVEYSLDITVVGEGTTYPEPGTTTITEGEDVFIRAIPDEGYVFDHWEGDVSGTTSPIMVTMTSDKNVVAVFVEAEVAPEEVAALPPIQLTVIDAERGGIRLLGDDLEPYGIDDVPPVNSPWTITIPKGSTITVTIGVSAHPTAGDHHLIIEGSDPPVDVQLGLGEELPPRDLTFNEVGTFKVYSEMLPDELHGTIVVEEPTPEVGALPPINFSIGDAYIRLKGDDLAPYGAELTTPEHESPWTMTIKKGSTITITEIYVSGKPGTLNHNLTIEGTDIDVTLGEGEGVGPFEVTFDEAGTFKVYCNLHPDDHGETLIIVEE